MLGPIIAGTAVADTVGGLIEVGTGDILGILLAALVAAVTWNLLTWRFGLPSSSSHALVGGLVGAALVIGGAASVNWGGFEGWRPVGVAGVLVALAISPLLGALAGWLMDASARRALRRADQRVAGPLKRGQWGTSAALAFAHGTNDAQKTMGLITLALVSAGALSTFVVPLWVKVACAAAMTFGTALGGWRIVRTLGRGIYRIRPLDRPREPGLEHARDRRRGHARGTGQHHARRGILGRGCRRRPATAARPLAGGWRDPARLGRDNARLRRHGRGRGPWKGSSR